MREWGLPQKSFMLFFLDCICSHQYHGPNSCLAFYSQWEHGSWTSSWFLATAQTTNMAPGYNRTTDPKKALRGITGASHQNVSWKQHSPQTSGWSQAAAQTMDLLLAFGGTCATISKQTQLRDYGLSMALRSSMGLDTTMASSTAHSGQYGLQWPHGPWASPWLQVAAQTMNIHMAFEVHMGHRHQHRPWLW